MYHINKQNGNNEEAKLNFISAINSIPKKYYNECYEEIGELVKSTFDVEVLREVAIDMVSEILEQKIFISPQVELYLRERIRSLYILSNKYAEVTNSLIESINISKEIDDKYSLADSMISLGVVFMELGGKESAENLFNEALNIEIENDKDNATIKTYGYLNLMNLLFFYFEDAEGALSISEEIEKYRNEFSEEDFRDIEIYKLVFEADSYITANKLDKVKEKLEKATELLREDKNSYYINKDLEYYLAYGRYFYAKKEYKFALEIYEYVLNETKLLNYKDMQKIILREIIFLVNDMEDYDKSIQYTNDLIELNKEREHLRYYDYTVYISNSIEKQEQIKHRYNQFVLASIILYISLILILLFYIYSNKKIKKLRYSSENDSLTSVSNRKKFDIDYNCLHKRKKDFACIIMDIDNLKNINDTYGHGFGDIVLKNSCKKIKNLLPENYNLYRYGGEEFIILAQYENKHEVVDIAENIRKNIEEMTWKENIMVTISIGIAFSPEEKNKVLEVSDLNLYKAKNNGKNRVIY